MQIQLCFNSKSGILVFLFSRTFQSWRFQLAFCCGDHRFAFQYRRWSKFENAYHEKGVYHWQDEVTLNSSQMFVYGSKRRRTTICNAKTSVRSSPSSKVRASSRVVIAFYFFWSTTRSPKPSSLVSWSQICLLNSIAVFETVRSYQLKKTRVARTSGSSSMFRVHVTFTDDVFNWADV